MSFFSLSSCLPAADANLQVRQLSEELAKKVEDSLRQQEEITQLLAQVVDLQVSCISCSIVQVTVLRNCIAAV